jgi:nucleotide-binding universal stress UspA family protein
MYDGRGRVVVGVAEDDAEAGLVYAADEAGRRGCDVHLVHVLHHVYAGTPDLAELQFVGDELRAAGSLVLERAEARSRGLLGPTEQAVTSELLHGPVAPTLVGCSDRADLVVLQRPAHKGRIHVFSVVNGVAARAHAPVVVVPATWRPGQTHGPVMVGVEDSEDSIEVCRAGLVEARRRRVPAELLHGWWHSDRDDKLLAGPAGYEQSRIERARIDRELAPVLTTYEDVVRHVRVVHERPADLLVAASRTAGLVVVGRHHPSLPFGSHLGPIVRAVLWGSECPVMVVDPRRSRR